MLVQLVTQASVVHAATQDTSAEHCALPEQANSCEQQDFSAHTVQRLSPAAVAHMTGPAPPLGAPPLEAPPAGAPPLAAPALGAPALLGAPAPGLPAPLLGPAPPALSAPPVRIGLFPPSLLPLLLPQPTTRPTRDTETSAETTCLLSTIAKSHLLLFELLRPRRPRPCLSDVPTHPL